jgi:hypothetical protein
MRLSARRDPAFHTVATSDDSVLDIVHTIAAWVDTALNRRLHVCKVVWVDACPPHGVISRCAGWQTPQGLYRIVPLQFVGLWIPRVTTELGELNCGL